MRLRILLALNLTFLILMVQCATPGRILEKKHLHKRTAKAREIKNDFGALAGVMGVAFGAVPGMPGDAGASGNDAKQADKCAAQNEGKCNVKEVIQPGDPKQKSSAIALKAAADAKAASEAQLAAGQAAAHHIKLELAEKAFQSAKAAEAALMGKQMMVDQLEQEVQEANAVVQEETNGLHATESNMNAAVEAARAATAQYETISELQRTSRENLANIQSVAAGAQNEMAQKTQLLEAARNRMAVLHKQLLSAQEDYEKTKAAAYKAACAAVEAKQKANNLVLESLPLEFDWGLQRLSRQRRSLKNPAEQPRQRFRSKLIFCNCEG